MPTLSFLPMLSSPKTKLTHVCLRLALYRNSSNQLLLREQLNLQSNLAFSAIIWSSKLGFPSLMGEANGWRVITVYHTRSAAEGGVHYGNRGFEP